MSYCLPFAEETPTSAQTNGCITGCFGAFVTSGTTDSVWFKEVAELDQCFSASVHLVDGESGCSSLGQGIGHPGSGVLR